MKRFLGYDKGTGLAMYHHWDEASQTAQLETVQDCNPILEANKMAANTDLQKKGIKNNMMFVGSIPNLVIQKWLQEGINLYDPNDWEAVKKKLNSSEYMYLKAGNAKL